MTVSLGSTGLPRSGGTSTGKQIFAAGIQITDDDGTTSIDGYRSLLDIRPPNADPEVCGLSIKLPGTAWGIGQDYAEGNYLIGLSDADNFGAAQPANILKTITATTNATPVKVTAGAHGLTTGDIARITDTGIAALDGKFWKVTVVDVNNVTLDGSTAPGSTAAVGNLFTDRSSVLWRIADSGPGWTGAMHLAAGLRGRAGSSIPTYGLWIQPAADLISLLIHNAATDKLATTPTVDYISVIDVRGGTTKRFGVNAAGQTLHDPGTSSLPGISFVGVTDTGLSYSGGFLSLCVAGVIPMTLTSASVSLGDAVNFGFATGTGTKIGTATGQKIGFWNATPIVRPASANQAAVAATGSTNVTPFGYTTAAQADAIVTLVNALRTALVNMGLIKGSA